MTTWKKVDKLPEKQKKEPSAIKLQAIEDVDDFIRSGDEVWECDFSEQCETNSNKLGWVPSQAMAKFSNAYRSVVAKREDAVVKVHCRGRKLYLTREDL